MRMDVKLFTLQMPLIKADGRKISIGKRNCEYCIPKFTAEESESKYSSFGKPAFGKWSPNVRQFLKSHLRTEKRP